MRKKGDIAALITPYNPPKFHKPVKRRKGMIDLTSLGRQEQYEEAVAKMRASEHTDTLQDERAEEPLFKMLILSSPMAGPKKKLLGHPNITKNTG